MLVASVPNIFAPATTMSSAAFNANLAYFNSSVLGSLNQENVGLLRGALRWSVSSGKAIDINLTQTGGNGRALSIAPTGGASLSGSTSLVQVSVPRVLSEAALYVTGNFAGPLITAVGSARAVLATSPNQALKISHTGTPTGASIDLSQSGAFAYPWPVMTSAQRAAITSQPAGSTVFDSNYQTLWCFNGTSWQNQLVPDNTTLEWNGSTLQVKDQSIPYSQLGAVFSTTTLTLLNNLYIATGTGITIYETNITTTKPNQTVFLNLRTRILKTSYPVPIDMALGIKQNNDLIWYRGIGGMLTSGTVGDLTAASHMWIITAPGTYNIKVVGYNWGAQTINLLNDAQLILLR
jgi:hypothetical protein